MKTTETENGVLIQLNELSTKLKILFSFEALLGIIIALIPLQYTDIMLNNPADNWGLMIFSVIAIIVGVLLFYRYLKRVLQKESISLNKDMLTIINSSFLKKSERSFEINKISNLNYMGRGKKTDHPLKGKSFDYLGFETQELVIAEVNTEGNLSFVYNNKVISFGKDIYSWDAEKINDILVKLTNGALTIGNLPQEISEDSATEEPIAGN